MAELSSIYASTLLELASENYDEYLEQAILLRDTLKDEECQRVLIHPHISAKEKREFIYKAFGNNLNNNMLGFLYMTIDKNRESFIVPALTLFISLVDQKKSKTTAHVVSAYELSDNQVLKLKELLSDKISKQVDISLEVDPSVIGGLYIHVDGFMFDRTIKTRLRDLKTVMKEVCV